MHACMHAFLHTLLKYCVYSANIMFCESPTGRLLRLCWGCVCGMVDWGWLHAVGCYIQDKAKIEEEQRASMRLIELAAAED